MTALSYAVPFAAHRNQSLADFRNYLEQTLYNPFAIDLEGLTLMQVIKACIKAKSRLHPGYKKSLNCLIYNLQGLEKDFRVELKPVQITDIFWGYFIPYCQSKGLRSSTINTLCNQLRSILSWASKYNATVSPTYGDFDAPRPKPQEIALTADEVSRITYFDIDRFYANRRKDFRETMHKVRDMFVLSVQLYQRHSDMVRISPSCFDRNLFKIAQQKTGNVAIVNIDKYSAEPKTAYRLLEKYQFKAPYAATIGNYNYYLHILMRDIGLNDIVRIEEKINGTMVIQEVPKWKLLSSHSARRTAITIGVLRGYNLHDLKKCSGHTDLRHLEEYIRD